MANRSGESTVNSALFDETWNTLIAQIHPNADSEKNSIHCKWKGKIIQHYSEPHRFYHTMDHIEEMLRFYKLHEKSLKQPSLVLLAIVFHDVIYEPKESDNEEKSAQLFQNFAKDIGIDESATSTVTDWIEMTKSHRTNVHDNEGLYGSDDIHYLLDFDMAVLGRPSEQYTEYSKQIRREYIHIPEQNFVIGRARVLESFLKIPNIFATEIFRSQFEVLARRNIDNEIQMLKRSMAN